MKKTRAVVVFSGGQDSTTCLIKAMEEYDEIHCLTFNYGQKHSQEIEVAQNIARLLGVKSHKIINADVLNLFAKSSLTRDEIAVPEYNTHKDGDFPSTFVPGRNIFFLTLSAIYAYQICADTVITGVCETDFSGYPDCRNEFIKAMTKAIALGMDKNITISTPLMWLTKSETWALADSLGKLDFIISETLTCYNGIKSHGCGKCDACYLRNKGLSEYLRNKEKINASLLSKQA